MAGADPKLVVLEENGLPIIGGFLCCAWVLILCTVLSTAVYNWIIFVSTYAFGYLITQWVIESINHKHARLYSTAEREYFRENEKDLNTLSYAAKEAAGAAIGACWNMYAQKNFIHNPHAFQMDLTRYCNSLFARNYFFW